MGSIDPFVTGGTAHGLLAFLFTWLRRKSHFLGDLPYEMKLLKWEMELVASLTEVEAVEGNPVNSVIRVRLSLLRDAAYKAEEVVDEFECLLSRSPDAGVMGLRKAWFTAATLLEKNRIACRTNHARKKFDEINMEYSKRLVEAKSAAQPVASSSVELQPERLVSFPVNYNDDSHVVVGMDRERRALVELLEDGERRRVVVGVKGMGGLGKTTLVHSAYSLVKTGFDCCVWLTVSLSYSMSDLRWELLSQIMGSSSVVDINGHEVAERIGDGLRKKRYLVVFDDLWDPYFWHELVCLIPNNNMGSRIIITTRAESVALTLGENWRDIKLSPLSPDHAWDLFFHVAFPGGTCPQDIESSARSIVAQCGGLPLAILTMARLMASREQSVEEWSSVESRFGWYLHNHKSCEVAKRTLLRRFKKLPYNHRHLQGCFWYLSIFPKDFWIRKKKLIRLWVSEGLVGEDERYNLTLEDLGQICLTELIRENLVEISTDRSGKEAYKMHNVMRELALWAAMEERFLVILDGKSGDPCCRARRLSIQTRGKSICLDCKGQSHLHSILNFDTCCVLNDPYLFSLKKMWSHVKFLRVLDLEGLRIRKCPDGLNELFSLRYLSLRKTGIENLPHGLEKLPSLETIDLRETKLKKIPLGRGIKSMLPSDCVHSKYLQRLRHLLYDGPSPPSNSGYVVPLGIPPPKGVCEFISLQTLAHIKGDEAFVTNVGKLIYLKKIGITSLREVDGEKLLSSLEKMFTLEHLSITAAPGEPLMLESASSSPPISIRKLVLIGTMRGGILPTWITSLKYLTRLRLTSSKLINDPLPALQVLLNLELIELRDAYLGKKLKYFPARSFFQLNKLELWDLPKLESISIEPDALRDIREMHFYNCKKLTDYPQREDLRYHRSYKFDIFN